MTVDFVSSRAGRWSSRASMAALPLLVAAVVVPDGFLWAGVVCAGLIGSALVTAAVLGSRAARATAGGVAGVEVQPLRVMVLPERIAGNSNGAAQRSKGD
jgi:hypothetical protein